MNLDARRLGVLAFLAAALPALATAFPRPEGSTARDSYVLSRDHTTMISGSLEKGLDLRARYGSAFLWFRRNGREYVVRDPRIVDEAAKLFEPLRKLEPDQHAVAGRVEALDREEEVFDREQEDLDADAEDLDQAPEDADVSEREAELERRQESLSQRRSELAERQREVAKREEALDLEEEHLEEAAEASLWKLIDRTIRDATAAPAPAR